MVFQHPTPRAIAAHLAELGAPAEFATPAAVVALLESVVATVVPAMGLAPPMSQAAPEAAIGSAGFILRSPALRQLTPLTPGASIFAIPNGTGSADSYKTLALVTSNTIYAVTHPHLSAELRETRTGLEATSIEQLADGWSQSIVDERQRSGQSAFVLVGASLGGLMAHLVAQTAHRRDAIAEGLGLIDPSPPIRPLATAMKMPGVRGAAAYLALHTIDRDVAFLGEVQDADLGVRLAARQAELGLAPFTETAVLERQRELRASTHLLDLAAYFQSHGAGSYKIQSPVPVWLTLAAERQAFFTEVGLTADEAGAAAARLYGNLADEVSVPGSHLEVCQRCMVGEVDDFNIMLCRALGLID